MTADDEGAGAKAGPQHGAAPAPGLRLDLSHMSIPALAGGATIAQDAASTGSTSGGAALQSRAAGETRGSESAAPADADQGAVPALTAGQAALRRVLFRRRGPLIVRQAQQQAAVLLGPVPPGVAADPADTPWLSLTIDGAPAAAALPWSLSRRLLGQPLEAADPRDAALLLEDALGDWLDAAELATGLAIRLDRLDATCPDIADGVSARLSVDLPPPRPARQALVLRLSPGAAHAAAHCLARLTRPRGEVGALMLRVSILQTAARLTLAELASLSPGDALAMSDDAGDAAAVVEGQLAAPVSPTGTGAWTLRRGFSHLAEREPHLSRTAERTDMTQTDTDPAPVPPAPGGNPPTPGTDAAKPASPAPAAGPAPAPTAGPGTAASLPTGPASLDALEVRLSVRLGETLISIADLREAGAGSVITLDRPDGAPVDLVVNGQVVGTGQIISVAGQKAVEIHSLFGNG